MKKERSSAGPSPVTGARRVGAKPPWRSFELRDLGSIPDLVRGGGKTGLNADGDPQVAFKGGVG